MKMMSDYNVAPSDVCAVITTFRPTHQFPDNVARIVPQVHSVIIVDDGASADNVSSLKKWFSQAPNIFLLHNDSNRGIAYSLNAGIETARKKGFSWVLLLDDDSVVPFDVVSRLLVSLRDECAGHNVAAIGADYSLKPGGENPAKGQTKSYQVLARITSGSLVSVTAFSQIGTFNENYFIDYVDIEYCLRANLLGFSIRNVPTGMIHPVGSDLRKWGVVIKSQHPPVRQYYFFRNSTDVIRRYGARYPAFAITVLANQAKTFLKIILFQEDKLKRLMLMCVGLYDAVSGRWGKITRHHEVAW